MERAASLIVDACYKVYQALGPGLLESVYEVCLKHELEKRGLRVEKQVVMPVEYDGTRLDAGFRIDLLVEGRILIELKAVEKLHPLFDAQVITYLKLSGLRLGFLVNFNCSYLKDNLKRIIL